MTEEFRRHLAELAREDERLRAEHDEWMAHREPAGSPYIRKSQAGGSVLYREIDNASLAAPAPISGASYEEPGLNAVQLEELAHVIAEVQREFDAALERMQQRFLQMVVRLAVPAERAEESFYALRDRVARMEGQIERAVAQAIVELKSGNATVVAKPESDVVDLPNWRKRSDAA